MSKLITKWMNKSMNTPDKTTQYTRAFCFANKYLLKKVFSDYPVFYF